MLSVAPDGNVYACPDMTDDAVMCLGNVITGKQLLANPLAIAGNYPCHACEAQRWCRVNCRKGLFRAYVYREQEYRAKVVDPICETVKFLGREIAKHDLRKWYSHLSDLDQNELRRSKLYDYTEVIP